MRGKPVKFKACSQLRQMPSVPMQRQQREARNAISIFVIGATDRLILKLARINRMEEVSVSNVMIDICFKSFEARCSRSAATVLASGRLCR